MTIGRSDGASQPSQVAKTGRNGIDSGPGTWPAAKCASGRTSTNTPPSVRYRRAAAVSNDARVGPSASSAGPRRLSSPSRRKWGGKLPSDPSSAATNASSPSAPRSGLVATSRAMVLVRSAPSGAEQNEMAAPSTSPTPRRAHRINAENHSTSGYSQNPATLGYAPRPATSGCAPPHATSGSWSGGKLQARCEAS
jgi:hypothetical protein